MYQIGMFSKLGKVTIKTLRYYDEVGLLKPEVVDEASGYRYYTTVQFVELHKIVSLRQLGFSITEIAQLLQEGDKEALLVARRTQLERNQRTITDQLARLNYLLSQEGESMSSPYQAVIKDIPEYSVFSKRLTIPSYAALMNLMPQLGEEVKALNPDLVCVEPDYCFNVYHDGEYREHDIDVEMCQAVTRAGIEPKDKSFVFKTVPAATVVSVLHTGSYETLGEAYAFVLQWIEANDYAIADNIRESYIDGVWNKSDVADWLTEIQVPVVKK